MRITTVEQEKELIEFAQRAATRFQNNPKLSFYTDAQIKSGDLIALRWGTAYNSVVVMRLAEEIPTVYGQIIQETTEDKMPQSVRIAGEYYDRRRNS